MCLKCKQILKLEMGHFDWKKDECSLWRWISSCVNKFLTGSGTQRHTSVSDLGQTNSVHKH